MKTRGGKKVKAHVNLDAAVSDILEAVAKKMGQDPLYPEPSRSDLINKAAWLFIQQCKTRPELKAMIEAVEAKHATTNVVQYIPKRDARRRVAERPRGTS